MHYKKKILTISNLYPSLEHPTYGIFVKKFEEAIENENFVISDRAVISGRGRTVITKMIKYLRLYSSILIKVICNNYDLIYIHYISNSSPVLFFVARFLKRPIVINFHGGDLLQISGLERFTNWITTKVIKRAQLLVVPSMYFKDEVIDKYGVNESLVHVYPSGGIDLRRFQPLNREEAKKELHVSGWWVIGFVARIERGKRWDVFLRGIYQFAGKYPELKFKALIVGTGNQVEALLQLVKDLKIGNYVMFLGERDHRELPTIYNAMDVFAFITENESLGLVGLEAMACGTPVIASLVGGINGYLLDGVNGIGMKSLDELELREKIEYYYHLEPEKLESIRVNAMRTAEEIEAGKVTKSLARRLHSLINP